MKVRSRRSFSLVTGSRKIQNCRGEKTLEGAGGYRAVSVACGRHLQKLSHANEKHLWRVHTLCWVCEERLPSCVFVGFVRGVGRLCWHVLACAGMSWCGVDLSRVVTHSQLIRGSSQDGYNGCVACRMELSCRPEVDLVMLGAASDSSVLVLEARETEVCLLEKDACGNAFLEGIPAGPVDKASPQRTPVSTGDIFIHGLPLQLDERQDHADPSIDLKAVLLQIVNERLESVSCLIEACNRFGRHCCASQTRETISYGEGDVHQYVLPICAPLHLGCNLRRLLNDVTALHHSIFALYSPPGALFLHTFFPHLSPSPQSSLTFLKIPRCCEEP